VRSAASYWLAFPAAAGMLGVVVVRSCARLGSLWGGSHLSPARPITFDTTPISSHKTYLQLRTHDGDATGGAEAVTRGRLLILNGIAYFLKMK